MINKNYQIQTSIYDQVLSERMTFKLAGKVIRSIGLLIEARLSGVSIGSLCEIFFSNLDSKSKKNKEKIEAEVVGIRGKEILLMPFDYNIGINSNSLVILKKKNSKIFVGDGLLGRVIDARGNPIDDLIPFNLSSGHFEERNLYQSPVHPLNRKLITEPLDLGIKAINGLLTAGKGQRFSIMAGSGVGKSILLAMMARNTNADINVIALVGERGREVKEFIENDLGKEGLKKSIIIVETSDKSPLLRMRAAFFATTVAEYFRDQGKDVLLMMDSVTRFCMAQREIGLSMGEPPTTKGYTPSVFSTLPKLLERAGTGLNKGSITGIYTVLVDGDDMDDPIADSTRAILDGHIVLSRKIAEKNHFPAIDVLKSTSRIMRFIVDPFQLECSSRIKNFLAVYAEAEDLINIGAYIKGTNIKIDQSIYVMEKINEFLKQKNDEKVSLDDAKKIMHAILNSVDQTFKKN